MLKSLAGTERKYTINCTRIDTLKHDEHRKRKHGIITGIKFSELGAVTEAKYFHGSAEQPRWKLPIYYQSVIKLR